jgi:hypothetical protein
VLVAPLVAASKNQRRNPSDEAWGIEWGTG